ncbi:nucleoside triphosphate pyrophosphohydrolase [Alkalibacillus almallahensis]|uniref:nucleoside triphosphate pyrophosphohydrolase n=1 Tax=Alkalibacillus almallahensis TaxID=1379154 RepID=UPI001420A857|nr:nucleoside triphosphate pyrophosphohydrolase [Alkalibacillus almallahensis]NIK12701.1 tetrapyrrole methylase family protein/MazG family protein [Alkalibacillus almallahensis]
MGHIHIVGLGAGTIDQLPLGIYRQLIKQENVLTRTLDHPVIHDLQAEGVTFSSYDEVYEANDQFASVYETIAEDLIKQARQKDIIYTVPGHPMVAEKTVQLLLETEQDDITVSIEGGQSFIDPLLTAVNVDPIEGFQLLDGTALDRHVIQYEQHLLISQVFDTVTASDVKLTLMEDLPHDYPITIVHAAGSDQAWQRTVPLYELDRNFPVSNLITVYVPPQPRDQLHHTFTALREVIARLRGPGGCPWDQKQTHESLRPYLIEEAYEVIEAIDQQDDDHLAEELGDVLLQVMLHSQIGEDHGYFTVDDVIQNVTDKMVERHPHVFGDENVDSADDVKRNWEEIKQQGRPKQESVLDDVNESLPRLLLAKEIQKKVAKVGFDWKEAQPVVAKVYEELKEFEEAVANETSDEAELELGDVLFSLVNLARYYRIDPEVALNRTCDKFTQRFQSVEKRVNESNQAITDLSLEELEEYWQEIKRNQQ